jgi:hypothetical protein
MVMTEEGKEKKVGDCWVVTGGGVTGAWLVECSVHAWQPLYSANILLRQYGQEEGLFVVCTVGSKIALRLCYVVLCFQLTVLCRAVSAGQH